MRNWPAPTSIADLRTFHGFISFFRKHIDQLQELRRPLLPYLKNGAQFKDYLSDPAAQKAFDDLKNCVLGSFRLPDYSREFLLFTDSSQYGHGYALCQRDKTGALYLVSAGSGAFDATQQ